MGLHGRDSREKAGWSRRRAGRDRSRDELHAALRQSPVQRVSSGGVRPLLLAGAWVLSLVLAVLTVDRYNRNPIPTEPESVTVVPESVPTAAPVVPVAAPLPASSQVSENPPMEPEPETPSVDSEPFAPGFPEASAEPEASEEPQPEIPKPSELVLMRGRGGSFHVPGTVNNQSVQFLVDTAAAYVTVPEKLQDKLGLRRGIPTLLQTAKGIATQFETEIDELTAGPIRLRKIRAMIDPDANGSEVVLGRSALDSLKMAQGEGRLVLRPADVPPPKAERSMVESPVAVEPGEKPLVLRKSARECMRGGNRIDNEVIRCMQGQ